MNLNLQRIDNMKIGSRLGLGFGLLLLLVVAMVVFTVVQMFTLGRASARIEADLAAKSHVAILIALVKDNGSAATEMLLSTNSDYHAGVIRKIEERERAIPDAIATIERDVVGIAQDEKLIVTIKKDRALYASALVKVFEFLKTGRHAEATYLAGEDLSPALIPLLNSLKKLNDRQEEKLAASTTQISQTVATMRNLALGGGLVIVLLGFFIARRIITSITQPLSLMHATISEVERTGDYSKTVDLQSSDEVGQTAVAFNSMMASLQHALSNTNTVMDAVANGDFHQRVIVETRGDLAQLKHNINTSVEKLQITINALVDVMNAVASGDFSQRMTLEVSGDFVRMKEATNASIGKLQFTMQALADVMQALKSGDFDKRVDDRVEGDFKQVVDHTMQTLQVLLGDISHIMGSIAQGDLTQTLEGNYSGVFGTLKNDTNTTVMQLRDVVGRIKEAAEAINTAAQEIAAGNQDLSARTEEQASSLEETASSLEELNATVRNNAENSRQAKSLATNSNEIAANGGSMVKRIVTTMDAIQDSSKKIADIISVIDSIAFQTNILALNAAVEAARAGEQGRGFAVVASEVRNLAQRSATAAKEIKTLIAESSTKVDAGAKLVQEAGDTMDDVVTSFDLVANLVTEISEASHEQSSGIDQVTKAVSQMDEVTQQNAALVEEAAAAAEGLEEQARSLVQSVAMFKLMEGGTPNLPAAPLRNVTQAPPKRLASTFAPLTSASDDHDEWAEF